MNNFVYRNNTRIIFGKGRETEVGKWTVEYAQRILIVYGGGSIKTNGIYSSVINSLKNVGIEFEELGGVEPNPDVELVRKGINICKEENLQFVLAIGGGSVIDTAKAIAFGAKYEGDVWEIFEEKIYIKDTLPTGAILTLSASGSESGGAAVISNKAVLKKSVAGNGGCRPVFAILNPELTYTVSNFQKSCGSIDIFSHIIERYFTRQKNVGFTDSLCEAAMKTIIRYAPIILKNKYDYDSHAQIMIAGTYATNDLLGVGRTGDWASHEIEHQLSARYGVTHGAGLAIVIPAWMKYIYKNDLERFSRYAIEVWGIKQSNNLEENAWKGIVATENFFKDLGVKTKLLEYIPYVGNNIEDIAEKVVQGGPIGQFKSLNKFDIIEILNLAK
ncbi:MAG: iron-containing alcohol dehydrogenase [Clostridiales bacterium]|jgi:hypothetical protein|nr:iron-containing alcohol dehydrogenase [Clostridiales bacterium]